MRDSRRIIKFSEFYWDFQSWDGSFSQKLKWSWLDSQIEPSKRTKRIKNNIVGTLEKRRTEKKQMIDDVIVIRGASEEGTTHMSHTTSINSIRILSNPWEYRKLKRILYFRTYVRTVLSLSGHYSRN